MLLKQQHHLSAITVVIAAAILQWAIVPNATSLHAMDPQASLDPANGDHILARSKLDLTDTWSYGGENGPDNWSDLQDAYGTCEAGKQQSPIDIPSRMRAKPLAIDFAYLKSTPKITNNGRFIALQNFTDHFVTFENQKYELSSIEFHTPSEHTIGGYNYPMELQFIHKNIDIPSKRLGIAVFVELGKENPEVKELLIKAQVQSEVYQSISMDATQWLPKQVSGWAYQGSQTTPPCKEGVQWIVLHDAIEFSRDQAVAFRKLYPNNVRPVQNLNDRLGASKSFVISH